MKPKMIFFFMRKPESSTEEGMACLPDTGSMWAPDQLQPDRQGRDEAESCWPSPATVLQQCYASAGVRAPVWSEGRSHILPDHSHQETRLSRQHVSQTSPSEKQSTGHRREMCLDCGLFS